MPGTSSFGLASVTTHFESYPEHSRAGVAAGIALKQGSLAVQDVPYAELRACL